MVSTSQNAPTSSSLSRQTKNRPGGPSSDNISTKARIRYSSSPSSSWVSADDSPLYMAAMPMRNNHRPLSPMSNGAPKRKYRQSEPYTKVEDDDLADENVAWGVIYREISEWQKVCQAGRPNWWSPIPKWTRGRINSSWQEELHAVPAWCMHLDQFHWPEPPYTEQRRAVTDSYLTNNNKVQDLAHLIAIQLLGACFTLPPKHILRYTESTYPSLGCCSTSEVPKSRLISSLRMHTEARHSPSFGYQARNTSPTYRWHGTYDGPSLSRSRELSSEQYSLNTEAQRKLSRKRKVHCALHLTEDSATDCLPASHADFNSPSASNLTAAASTSRRLNSETGVAQKPEMDILDRNSKSCPSTPSAVDDRLLKTSSPTTRNFIGDSSDALLTYRYSRVQNQQGCETLRSTIRSEPHHIFIQPVKELVVKRWQTLRHRFGYGLGYVHHDPLVTKANAITSFSASSISSPAEESIESPVLSADGEERRLRVQGCPGTHVDSMGSSPRYNSPVSAAGSEITNAEQLEKPSPKITATKIIEITEAIAKAFAGSNLTMAVSSCLTKSDSVTSFNGHSRSATKTGSALSPTEPNSSIGSTAHRSKTLNSPSLSSLRFQGRRRHHRSNLSEICTPEEMEEPGILSGLASPFLNAKEKSNLEPADDLLSNSFGHEVDEVVKDSNQNSLVAVGSHQKQDEKSRLVPARGKTRRPSIMRTSTSGTQVFTPNEDSVELDGLPAGATWDEHGLGSERKERSFL